MKKLGFERLAIYRPGLLDRKEDARWNEKLFGIQFGTVKIFNKIKGVFSGGMDLNVMGKAMIHGAVNQVAPISVYNNSAIFSAAKELV